MSSNIDLDAPAAEPAPVSTPPRIGRNALATLIFKGGALPFVFTISIVTSRYLLPRGRGAFILALLTVTLTATLLGNIGAAAAHELRRKTHTGRAIVGEAVAISLVLGVAGAAVLYPLDRVFANRGFAHVAYAALALPAVLVVQTLASSLAALDRLRLANALQFLIPVATLGGMLAFVAGLGRGTTGAVAAWVLAQFLVAAVALTATRSLWWPPNIRLLPRERTAAMLRLGLRIGLVNIVSLLNYRIELLILQAKHGLADVGVYSLATSLAELLWLVSFALATASVAPAVSLEDDAGAAEVIARSVRWALIGGAVLGVGLAIGGWFLISPVFGPSFAGARVPLLILIPGVVAYTPASTIAVYFSTRHGQTRYPLLFSVVSLTVTAVLALVLIPAHAGTGAAIACTAGYSASIAVALFWFARTAGLPLRALLPGRSDLHSYRALRQALLGR